jgi:hypothetical protein
MADLITFNADVARRMRRMLDVWERGLDDTPNRRKRRPIGDDGGGCDKQNAKIQWTVFGKPTGGTFTSILTINAVSETITFNWDDDATDVDTALATHSELVGSDVTVTGGPFPNATIEVEFVGTQAETNIALPVSNWGSLTGGSGVAVLTSLSQLGHA